MASLHLPLICLHGADRQASQSQQNVIQYVQDVPDLKGRQIIQNLTGRTNSLQNSQVSANTHIPLCFSGIPDPSSL